MDCGNGLVRKRRRKHATKVCLREEKARMAAFEQISVGTKKLYHV